MTRDRNPGGECPGGECTHRDTKLNDLWETARSNITKATKEEPTQQYFPTEAAIKAKERRNKIKEEQGISSNQQQKTTKSKKAIQNHFDDCGNDFSPLLKYDTTLNLYTELDEFCESQHKFHTAFDLQTLYGPYLTTHARLPRSTTLHENIATHFMYLQQANDNYAMLELQLEINHCIDGQYRIVSRHGNSYYTQDHATSNHAISTIMLNT